MLVLVLWSWVLVLCRKLAVQAAYILVPASRMSTSRGILPSYLGLCWCNLLKHNLEEPRLNKCCLRLASLPSWCLEAGLRDLCNALQRNILWTNPAERSCARCAHLQLLSTKERGVTLLLERCLRQYTRNTLQQTNEFASTSCNYVILMQRNVSDSEPI